MAVTYAIPDIHGRYDLLQIAIDRIVSHAAGRPATVVTLGDYIDRGPCSRQVIERLMHWEFDHLSLVSLKGNHEAMMWQTCNNLLELERWLENGGDQTLRSYGNSDSDKFDLNLVPSSHLAWIDSLPAMHVDQHRVFVHAGVDPNVSLNQQSSQTLLWKRYRRDFAKGHGRRHVVHGHDADPSAPIRTTGRTNLDAMAWKTGRLAVGVFENDRPGGPAEILDVIGEPSTTVKS
ncbi:metallophosphoesterase [Bradyrhizobium sp. WYCCWR 13023]|uniref:Metallophosphoesterase n=1 Tax=Bradyrhizobium zhengyangense TaxID=2911009 RepID=A0A9X1RHC8_9BRAD|nr:metallophosphoesterase [Bradyrhizobium zhengyangense]MCG2632704.1 metallophosphoesterase [Bradyrhizobium zhengyangense]